MISELNSHPNKVSPLKISTPTVTACSYILQYSQFVLDPNIALYNIM